MARKSRVGIERIREASEKAEEEAAAKTANGSNEPKMKPGMFKAFEDREEIFRQGAERTDVVEYEIDPAECVVWERNARRHDKLTPENTADLIEDIRRTDGNTLPCDVRRVRRDDDIRFEIIAGMRRHFAVSYLRANGHPDLKLLVKVRSWSDQESFRHTDRENRIKQDVTAYARGMSYLRALEDLYGGVAKTMASDLGIPEAQLSRLLQLAKLPEEFVRAFGLNDELRASYASDLTALTYSDHREEVLVEAKKLADEQEARFAEGKGPLRGRDVLDRLIRSSQPRSARAPAQKKIVILGPADRPGIEIKANTARRFDFSLLASGGFDQDAAVEAFREQLARSKMFSSDG